MAAIANVGLDTTFDTWRIRSNRAFARLNALSQEDSLTTITANTVQANVALKVIGYANVQGQFTANNVIRVKGSTTFSSGDGLEIGWLNSNNASFAGYKNRATDTRGMGRFDFSSYEFDINGQDRFRITNTGIGFSNNSTTAALSIQSANTDSIVHVETTSDSTAAGPIMTLFRKPGAAASEDYIGQVVFKGIDNAKARKDYAKITGQIQDHSAGSEDGKIHFSVMSNGSTVNPQFEINNTGTKINSNFKMQAGANTYIGQHSSNTIMMAANTSSGHTDLFVSSNGVGIDTSTPAQKFAISAGHIRLDTSYGMQFGSTNDRVVGGTNYVDTHTNNSVVQSIKRHRVVYSANVVPVADSTYDLGHTSLYWQNLYADNAFHKTLSVTGNASTSSAANTNVFGGHLNVTANTSFNQQVVFNKAVTFSQFSSTTSGSVALDYDTYNNFYLTLNGPLTLSNPTTESVGQFGVIAITQDGTGGRTLSLGTDYESVQGAGYTLSTAAGATDLIPYYVIATDRVLLGMIQKSMA